MLAPDYESVIVWERNNSKRIKKTYDLDLSFFIQDKSGKHEDIYGNKLLRLEFDNFYDFNKAKKEYKANNILMYESDIPIEQKILSLNYYKAPVPKLNITFFDIEVDYNKFQGFSSVTDPYAPINSISLYHQHTGKRVIYTVPPQYSPWEPTKQNYGIDDISSNVTSVATVVLCKSERDLLDNFLYEIKDTDLLSGWNSDYFDIPYIYKRIEKVMGARSLRRLCFTGARKPTIKSIEREISAGFKVTDEIVKLHGRTALDYKIIYEKFEQENKASYALAYIAAEEFPELRKLEYTGSLYDLYRNDFSYYMEYNMIDTEILVELEKKLHYVELTVHLTHMATAQIEHVYGTIKLAELAIINYCKHELHRGIPDSKKHDYFSKYGGAIVLDCQSGEHKMTGSVDVESLYPRSIMSTNASPETIMGQFELNDKAYAAIANHTGEELTAEFEDGIIETKTTEEWREFFPKNNYILSGYGTIFDQSTRGFIPSILESWFDERRQYKAEASKYKKVLDGMTESDPKYNEIKNLSEHYDRLQYIKKIQLNSLYGCMGNKFFKFFDIRLAETTTKTGREILYHLTKHIGEILDGEYKYPTESVIYGDTDSCYFKTHAETIPEAKVVCSYIEKSINASFPKFMKTHFFCNDVNSVGTRVENEIISDIGIFVKKKIYLLHLVHKDGYDVDKMKIMGHAIRKTTLTPIVKKTLTDVIENYFKHHDWSKLNMDVVKFKNILETTKNFRDYGIPKKVNKVELYTNNLKDNPNTLLPGGQAAAIFWNVCLKTYNDKESTPITSQMSVRVYYLRQKFGRFSSIAVPTDLLVVPEWFIDNILPLVDRNKQVSTMVDKTLTNICNAIGKQIPTEKAILADELLVY